MNPNNQENRQTGESTMEIERITDPALLRSKDQERARGILGQNFISLEEIKLMGRNYSAEGLERMKEIPLSDKELQYLLDNNYVLIPGARMTFGKILARLLNGELNVDINISRTKELLPEDKKESSTCWYAIRREFVPETRAEGNFNRKIKLAPENEETLSSVELFYAIVFWKLARGENLWSRGFCATNDVIIKDRLLHYLVVGLIGERNLFLHPLRNINNAGAGIGLITARKFGGVLIQTH